jgi:hypothetical protein
MRKLIGVIIFYSLTLGAYVCYADAHEFLFKPNELQEGGAKIRVRVLARHFLLTSDEVEPVDSARARFVEADKSVN